MTCENVTCKNVSCEDVACENVTCENVTCRNVTCKNVTCGNVSCENVSCENVTCENVSCDVTCGNVTCENVTCKNVTCENVSCENVTCENVSCENVSCEEDVTFEKDCDQFKEKYDMVNKSFEAFKTLLDKTVINVFLREENKNKCMVSKLVYKILGDIRKGIGYLHYDGLFCCDFWISYVCVVVYFRI